MIRHVQVTFDAHAPQALSSFGRDVLGFAQPGPPGRARPLYTGNFQSRIAPRVHELLGRKVTAGVPVEIGRGCVKFAGNDACTFCSIHAGQLWRNQLGPTTAGPYSRPRSPPATTTST